MTTRKYLALLLLGLLAFASVRADDDDSDDADGDDDDSSENNYGKVIGIDLGTTYSCVGIYENGKVSIIANDQGNRITPSYVAFTETERLVGDAAKNQAAVNPENTIFDAKRMIGRKATDKEVKKDMKLWPFKVVDQKGKPHVQVNYKGEVRKFAPEE